MWTQTNAQYRPAVSVIPAKALSHDPERPCSNSVSDCVDTNTHKRKMSKNYLQRETKANSNYTFFQKEIEAIPSITNAISTFWKSQQTPQITTKMCSHPSTRHSQSTDSFILLKTISLFKFQGEHPLPPVQNTRHEKGEEMGVRHRQKITPKATHLVRYAQWTYYHDVDLRIIDIYSSMS